MKLNWIAVPVLACVSAVELAPSAHAGTVQPGSLLVFPAFDNTRGARTLLTVTNTDDDVTTGAVDVEFIYINGQNCAEFNRTRHLTPNDEFSTLTYLDNPNQVKGYCYVFAKNATTGKAIAFDHLVGMSFFFLPLGTDTYEIPPFVFKAGSGLAEGAETDLDHDGLRDLDGLEYEAAPDKLIVPSFLGQTAGSLQGDLILLNLTGGAQFTALVDFLVYNDNEEVFSAQYSFHCWARVPLLDISSVFDNEFLNSTNQNPNEVFVPAGSFPEVGWFRIDGHSAFSSAANFSDPAILAVRTTSYLSGPIGGMHTVEVASLPFTLGTQTNGSLLSHNLLGN